MIQESAGTGRLFKRTSSVGDVLFKNLTLLFALSVLGLAFWIALELVKNSGLSMHKFGWSFLWRRTWNPVMEDFGALPFIYGTLVSSAIALVIAIPLGLGVAIFLSELAHPTVADWISFLTELLAAIPSVVYGLIGVFVLVPWMRKLGAPYGVGMLTAGIVLAVMILPFIASISREVFQTVPQSMKESAISLGATRWEVLWMVTLPFARSGIMGSVFLALGRALGETMAVTMVIGNRPEIKLSLFQPGYTMAAVIANEFTEAATDLYAHTLIEIGVVLLGITVIVNGIARWMVYRLTEKAAET